MNIRNFIFFMSMLFILWGISCDWGDHKDNTCGDGEISAADAVWSHGEGDLQNTKRASGIRQNGCIKGPQTTPQVQWSFQVGGPGLFSPPVVADDGTIYIVGEYPGEVKGGGVRKAGIMALTSSGTMKWFFQIPLDIGFSITYLYFESPAIDPNGVIYFGGWDSTFYAIKPDSTLYWKYKMSGVPEGASPSTPAIDERNLIYVASPDTVFCFYESGQVKWRHFIERDCHKTTQISIGKEGIYVGLFGVGILALDFSGNTRWVFDIDFHDADFDQGIVIDEQENLYFKINHTTIMSVNSEGQFRWNGQTSDVAGQPILRGQFLYLASGRTLFKINKDSNEVVYSILLSDFIFYSTSPLIDDDGTIYVAEVSGVVDAIKDSTIIWSLTLPYADTNWLWTYLALTHDGSLLVPTAMGYSNNTDFRIYSLK